MIWPELVAQRNGHGAGIGDCREASCQSHLNIWQLSQSWLEVYLELLQSWLEDALRLFQVLILGGLLSASPQHSTIIMIIKIIVIMIVIVITIIIIIELETVERLVVGLTSTLNKAGLQETTVLQQPPIRHNRLSLFENHFLKSSSRNILFGSIRDTRQPS